MFVSICFNEYDEVTHVPVVKHLDQDRVGRTVGSFFHYTLLGEMSSNRIYLSLSPQLPFSETRQQLGPDFIFPQDRKHLF
jgi:hypothetical protein